MTSVGLSLSGSGVRIWAARGSLVLSSAEARELLALLAEVVGGGGE